jgi:hypothetical protein
MYEIDYLLSPFLKLEALSNNHQFSLTETALYNKWSYKFNIDYYVLMQKETMLMMVTGGYEYLW